MLIWLILIPVIASALIGLCRTPGRATALVSAGLTLVLGVVAILTSAFCEQADCLSTFCGYGTVLSLKMPMSSPMLLLTVIVTFAAILGLKAPDAQAERSWSISALLISAGATGAFISDHLLAFYAFHELALIPTFVMIGFYGRGERRTIAWRATIYLGLASMVLLAGLVLLSLQMGAMTFSGIAVQAYAGKIPASACLISALLLVGFGTLVSLFPFHSWAAPAYASAPTPIAMLHAGVLKKFGLYGLFMIAFAFGPHVSQLFGCWNNLLLLLLLGNVLWVGYVTVSQTRLDDMLGNSSVMHMGYLFLAFAAYVAAGGNQLALQGAGLLMVAHGLSIAMLFLLTGQIERQTRTLEISALGGLATKLPLLGFLFGLAGLASIGLPLLANFAGEFTIFVSCFQGWTPGEPSFCCSCLNTISGWLGGLGPVQLAAVFAIWGLVISAVYMLRAFRHVFEGQASPAAERATALSCSDAVSALLLASVIVLFGVAPFLLFF